MSSGAMNLSRNFANNLGANALVNVPAIILLVGPYSNLIVAFEILSLV